jgi:hypothetical protein
VRREGEGREGGERERERKGKEKERRGRGRENSCYFPCQRKAARGD